MLFCFIVYMFILFITFIYNIHSFCFLGLDLQYIQNMLQVKLGKT